MSKRYVAFLRGVMPQFVKNQQLKDCFEKAGFGDVKTVLASGNLVFDASGSESALERKIVAAMEKHLKRVFAPTVREVDDLVELLEADAFSEFPLKPGAKRVVTFLRDKPGRITLPPEVDGARILCVRGREVYSAYVPSPKGPVFMTLIEKTFGKDVTTRTWDTIRKVVG